MLEVNKCPKIRAGTYIFSSLCSTTGIPFPLFHIVIVLDSLMGYKHTHTLDKKRVTIRCSFIKPEKDSEEKWVGVWVRIICWSVCVGACLYTGVWCCCVWEGQSAEGDVNVKRVVCMPRAFYPFPSDTLLLQITLYQTSQVLNCSIQRLNVFIKMLVCYLLFTPSFPVHLAQIHLKCNWWKIMKNVKTGGKNKAFDYNPLTC